MSTWTDIAQVVGKAAPIVGTLLGGPAGAAVGGLVAAALGTQNSPDAVNAALAADPNAMEKVIEVQINARVQLQQLAVTAEQNRLQADSTRMQAQFADLDSARKAGTASNAARDWWVRPMLAVITLLGAISISVYVCSSYATSVLKDTTAVGMIGTVIGFVFNELKQVFAYFFGSTSDSSATAKAITAFAVSPGAVTTAPTPVEARNDLSKNWTN